VKWENKQEKAFTEIKQILSSEPILRLPDLNRECILQTDASNLSLGACLLQEHEGIKIPSYMAAESCSQGKRIILLGRGKLWR